MSIQSSINILLVRHGRPSLAWPVRCSATDFHAWTRRYRDSGLDTRNPPPLDLVDQVTKFGEICWISSPLRRARDSCLVLSGGAEIILLQELSEVVLPAPSGASGEKSASDWIENAILTYNAGSWRDCETPEQLRKRAQTAAQKLMARGASAECVVAVGHGLINRLVADELVALGMALHAVQPGEYWRWQHFRGESVNSPANSQSAVVLP